MSMRCHDLGTLLPVSARQTEPTDTTNSFPNAFGDHRARCDAPNLEYRAHSAPAQSFLDANL